MKPRRRYAERVLWHSAKHITLMTSHCAKHRAMRVLSLCLAGVAGAQ